MPFQLSPEKTLIHIYRGIYTHKYGTLQLWFPYVQFWYIVHGLLQLDLLSNYDSSVVMPMSKMKNGIPSLVIIVNCSAMHLPHSHLHSCFQSYVKMTMQKWNPILVVTISSLPSHVHYCIAARMVKGDMGHRAGWSTDWKTMKFRGGFRGGAPGARAPPPQENIHE